MQITRRFLVFSLIFGYVVSFVVMRRLMTGVDGCIKFCRGITTRKSASQHKHCSQLSVSRYWLLILIQNNIFSLKSNETHTNKVFISPIEVSISQRNEAKNSVQYNKSAIPVKRGGNGCSLVLQTKKCESIRKLSLLILLLYFVKGCAKEECFYVFTLLWRFKYKPDA